MKLVPAMYVTTFCRRCAKYTFQETAVYKRHKLRDRILRVDHAGELGADRIYAGQFAVLKNTATAPVIKEMWEEEKEHLQKFQELIPKYHARPSALLPFWNVAGYILGAGSALLGKSAAMACTVAVEEVIANHYNNQIRELVADDAVANEELLSTLKKFRDAEQHHHDIGLEHDAEQAPFYKYFSQVIKIGCRTSIWLAEKF